MKPVEFFYLHQVFTHQEWIDYLKGKGTMNPNTQRELLAYYVHTKRVQRVRRGLFVSLPPVVAANEYRVDPYLICQKLSKDAVIAYHSALELHGASHAYYQNFTYLSNNRSQPFIFQEQSFQAISYSKRLHEKQQTHFDVTQIIYQGTSLTVTGMARTVVDVLDRVDLCGGWDECWRSLELVHLLDVERAIQYASLIDKSVLYAKLGYYLQKHQQRLAVSEHQLDYLKQRTPKQALYVERHSKDSQKNRLIPQWNLLIPRINDEI